MNICISSFTKYSIYWNLHYIVLIRNGFISKFCGLKKQRYYSINIMYISVMNRPLSHAFRKIARFYLYGLRFDTWLANTGYIRRSNFIFIFLYFDFIRFNPDIQSLCPIGTKWIYNLENNKN
jgi:hypothetical protein